MFEEDVQLVFIIVYKIDFLYVLWSNISFNKALTLYHLLN